MVKKMNKTESSFFESRRTFLKGTVYTVAGATVAKGVFSTIVDTPAMAEDTKFTSTPESLSFYPPLEEWNSFTELDGQDWKRGGVSRNGIASEENPDGIKVVDYMLVPTA
ncbi:MAG TPA: twin-arginine translocation signal domain-containing protein, partial [Campylobacterales bacterium]|nr:twin-arginine translocation signal domain-containing protein [Campylobacterales bacterium]